MDSVERVTVTLWLNTIMLHIFFLCCEDPFKSNQQLPIFVLSIWMITEEVQHQLCQLQLLNGLQTDPNKPGVEVVTCLVQGAWLFKPATKLTAADLSDPNVAGPGQLFVVKGWNRSLCAVGILFACYQNPELLQEGFPPSDKKCNIKLSNAKKIPSLEFQIDCFSPWEELPDPVRQYPGRVWSQCCRKFESTSFSKKQHHYDTVNVVGLPQVLPDGVCHCCSVWKQPCCQHQSRSSSCIKKINTHNGSM